MHKSVYHIPLPCCHPGLSVLQNPVQVLSEYTGLSASYLSRLFKKELGISISDYILEKKIEKSENLLKYSDYSLVDIANYLAFSSQSHFIQTFKKAVGITPNKYRNQYYHSSW